MPRSIRQTVNGWLNDGFLNRTYGASNANDEPNNCTVTLQSLINATASGGTLDLSAYRCVFRESVTLANPITIDFAHRAQMRGSDVYPDSTWTVSGTAPNRVWTSTLTVPSLTSAAGSCDADSPNCKRAEQVFMNGVPLVFAGDSVTPVRGCFALSASRQVILRDDPIGRQIEVTTRTRWMRPANNTIVNNVTVKNGTFKHCGNAAQSGGLQNYADNDLVGTPFRGTGWTIRDNTLHWAHGANVSLLTCSSCVVSGNDIAYGGNLGMHGSQGTGLTVTRNGIHHNNTAAYSGAEAGGAKFTRLLSTVWTYNEVWENFAKGLWFDVSNDGVEIAYNRVWGNESIGIFYEVSWNARIHHNVVWENGHQDITQFWGSGILLGTSDETEVDNNVLAWNAGGIGSLDDVRVDNPAPLTNIRIHHNDIIAQRGTLLGYAGAGGTLGDPANGNGGNDNRYWWHQADGGSTSSRWEWMGGAGRTNAIAVFNATPGEENGTYLTTPQRDALLALNDVPITPQTR